MWQNTKLVILFSFFVIFLGLSLVWFGLKPSVSSIPQPTSTPVVETTPVAHLPEFKATSSAVIGMEGERVLVTKVVDGDTFAIEGGLMVRMLGIDTPETVDPKRPVECFGKQASNETKNLISGKIIVLQKDVSETDKYGRLLRYIFLPLDPSTSSGQLLFVNDYLIRAGFAKALTYPPDVKYTEQFLEAQIEAKVERRGLWGRC